MYYIFILKWLIIINNNIENYIELDINENNLSKESDSEDDILFNPELYSLKKLRKEVILKISNDINDCENNLHLKIIIIINLMVILDKYFIYLY